MDPLDILLDCDMILVKLMAYFEKYKNEQFYVQYFI